MHSPGQCLVWHGCIFVRFLEKECSNQDYYPSTSITYDQEDLRCLDFSSDAYLRRLLQLGLYCGGKFTGQYAYTDNIAECQDPDNLVVITNESAEYTLLEGDEERFTCLRDELVKYDSYKWDQEEDYLTWYDNRGVDITVPSLTIKSEPTYRFPGTDTANCLDYTPTLSSSSSSASANGTLSSKTPDPASTVMSP
jgi:hypothetical protein